MRVLLTVLLTIGFITGMGCAQAQTTTAKTATTKPAADTTAKAPAATAPTTQLSVVAKVGDKEIKATEVERIIVGNPQAAAQRSKVIDMLVAQELIRQYLAAHKVECTPDELKAKKADLEKIAKKADLTVEQVMLMKHMTDQDLRDQVGIEKLVKQQVDAKVADFIKNNPAAFDGTKVKASHILIKIEPTAPTADQQAAKAKLEAILADIKAGKIKFDEAAKKFSDCPSKEKGGDLGEFTYGQMVAPFSKAAFNTPIGQTTGVIQTRFGYHVVLVTARTDGKEKPEAEAAKEAARGILTDLLQTEIFAQGANGVKVEVYEKNQDMPMMMPQGMPGGE